MTATPGRRSDYIAFRTMPTRWFDNDVYGHMNNALHYQFFDTAVNAPLVERGLLDPATSPTIFLVVESGCRYFAPLAFPQDITAGLRVAKLGRSAVTYELGLFGGDAEVAAAEGHFVHVNVDRATNRPAPIPDQLRAYLEDLRVV